MQPPVSVQFSAEEALVLFEWLSRSEDGEALAPTFIDEAEQKVLWLLQAQLERSLVALFAPNYEKLLANARVTVRNPP
jgi:hypothetical protein